MIIKKVLVFCGFISILFLTVNNLCAQESANDAYQKGANNFKKGMFDQAIAEFSRAIELNPRLDAAYYDRARAYEGKGDPDKAMADYTMAIDIHSIETIQAAYNNRGLLYEKRGDLDKAIEDYTKGIEELPNPTFSGYRYFKETLHRNRAEVYLLKKEYDKAWEDVRAIEKAGGDAGQAFIQRLKNRDSSPAGGASGTAKVSEKYPGASSDVNFYNNRGYESYKNGNYDSAIADYDRAIQVDQSYALVYANRANAYCAKRDFDKAISDFNKALEINPKDFNVLHDLGSVYVNLQDFDKAIFYYNKSLENNPDLVNSGQFHNDRGVAYFWKREYAKCWEDVNKAIELGYKVHPEFLRELKKATGRDR